MREVRATFVCEATVGHTAFLSRLQAAVLSGGQVEAAWFALSAEPVGILERVPPFSRIWTARAALRARRLLDHHAKGQDVLFFHTVGPSLLSNKWLRRTPSIISVDATPINVDQVGAGYGHVVSSPVVEALKMRLVRRALVRASWVVAWSHWVERSLLSDYEVDPAKIIVQPPGVPIDHFRPSPPSSSKRVRLLFVGGDFRRKGGDELLEAIPQLPETCELDIVTATPVREGPRIRVHHGLGPDDDRLQRLYAAADVFVLPTRADTWGHAVVEAMASGLPVITTAVGGLAEIVTDGVEGLVVSPGDVSGLARAITCLVADPSLRHRLGAGGRHKAVTEFDADRNLGRIVELVSETGRRPRPS